MDSKKVFNKKDLKKKRKEEELEGRKQSNVSEPSVRKDSVLSDSS